MKTKKKISIGILISLILVSSSVFAFGIGCAYHQNRPLEIVAEGSKEINFNLQNMPGPEDVLARPNIIQGSEILQLASDEDIFVPVGGSVDVKATVTLPPGTKVGDVFPVEISFTTVTEGETGEFGFGSSVSRKFDVIATTETGELKEEMPITLILTIIIAAIIIIAIIIYIIVKKRKQKQ